MIVKQQTGSETRSVTVWFKDTGFAGFIFSQYFLFIIDDRLRIRMVQSLRRQPGRPPGHISRPSPTFGKKLDFGTSASIFSRASPSTISECF